MCQNTKCVTKVMCHSAHQLVYIWQLGATFVLFVLFLDNANDYSRTFSVARSDHCPPLTKGYISALWAEFVFVIIFHLHTPLFFFASQATFFLHMIMLVVLIFWNH